MATINKYTTETTNITDSPLTIYRKYKYTTETTNITEKTLYGKRYNKYISETTDIFATNKAIKPETHLEVVDITEDIYFYKYKRIKTTENLQIDDKIKPHIQHYILYYTVTKPYLTNIDYNPTVTFFDIPFQSLIPNKTPVKHPTINGLKPIIIENNSLTEATPITSDIYLYEKNMIKTDKGNFEFRLGIITTEKKLQITISSTYNKDLTIDSITSDYNLGIYTEFPNGKTISTKSGLTFNFTIKIDEGKKFVENKVYFHLSNGLIINWKLCFVRALTNLYFLPPDKNTYKENYIFSSKTFVSLEGKKDVIAFMDTPKYSFSATYSYRPFNELEAIRNVALMNEYKNAYFPIWSELSKVTQNQTSPSFLIYVERINSFLQPNTKAAIVNLKAPMNFNIINIEKTDQNKGIIVSSNPITYTTDYALIPVVEVVLTQDTSTQYYNIKDQKLSISVRTLK